MSGQHRFGPQLHADGVTFRIWAPAASTVELILDRPQPMQAHCGGWHELTVAGAGARTRYKYRIDGEIEVPDPASHFQPEDVSGPSEVIDHGRYAWTASNWRGRPWHEAVMLECHVGTFTPDGTFRAMIEKLDHVAAAGITAIELMPIADFPGRWNWGYDGVLLYAPDSIYGGPDDLKALIDEAHLRGLMVLLDVVYNHFGPEGNYLGRYAPGFFRTAHTPWGAAIDYRSEETRAFVIGNALHWLDHYRFDGLRLDAVHAIIEPGARRMLADLSRAVGQLAAARGRSIHLVLENDDNAACLLDPAADPPCGRYRAQWNDDYHHAWHTLLTGEDMGYYRDYADDPRRHLARTLGSGFAYQGEPSAHRAGKARGEPSRNLSPLAFVNFLQNHDQIGNRARGDRLTTQVDAKAMQAALSVMLLAPMPPLLFMGEEWGSRKPFPFFCDFHGELAEAVRKGRRAEFKQAYALHGNAIPDPLAADTFRATKLDWETPSTGAGRERLAFVKDLLRTRRDQIVPLLAQVRFGAACFEGDVLTAHWHLGGGRTLVLLANLSACDNPRPDGCSSARPIWGGAVPAQLPAWSVHWAIGDG
jgi:1,4-alpha-glucan branching enzyme/maltooligosyltrehalose trehalohydrolase